MTRLFALPPVLTLLAAVLFNHSAVALVHDESEVSIPTRSLVRVVVEQEVSAIVLGNNYQARQKVRQTASFDGFVLDSNGHVVVFVGEYTPSLQADEVRFTVETHERKRYPAQPVGLDDRIRLAVVRADLTGASPLPRASDRSFKHFNVISADQKGCPPQPACLLDSSTEDWLPFSVLKVSGLRPRTDQCQLPGTLALHPKGALLGFIVYMSPHRYNDKLAYTYVLPSRLIESSASAIVSRGESVPGGWLGIYLAGDRQPTVDWVTPNSPAERAGLRARDVIMGIDGHRVRGKLDLIHAIRFKGPDRRALLDIRRGEADEKIVVSTGSRNPKYAAAWAIELDQEAAAYPARRLAPRAERLGWSPLMDLGLIVLQVNRAAVLPLSFQFSGGFLIRSILLKSRAAEVGFKTGDILFRINETDIDSFQNLQESVEQAPEGRLEIYYVREGVVKSSVVLVKP